MAVRSGDLLEKMFSNDKDFRFMAVNDIMESIKTKTITLDDATENQLVQNLLKLLQDPNAEVQNLVVKCIAMFAGYLPQPRLNHMLDALVTKIADSADEGTRDIAAITLRSTIMDFNSQKNVSFSCVVDKMMPQLIKLIADCQDHSVIEQSLDIISHMFGETGKKLDFNYDRLGDVLFQHAESERYGVRRRAQHALALYADVVDNTQFKAVITRVYECCKKYISKPALLKTYVSTTTAICKSSGQRFQDSLPAFTELFLSICNRSQDDELREVTINSFEMFFHRCPDAIGKFTENISKVVIALLSYDPNYSYDDSDNEDAMDVDEASNDGTDDDEDSDYSDDEDVSWKVRRASAKCIEAIINHRHDRLHQNYKTFGKLLIKRLKEREDNVKQDIMNAYMALIRQTRVLVPDNIVPLSVRSDGSSKSERISMENFNEFINDDSNPARKQVFVDLREQVPSLLGRIVKVQKTKNMKLLEHTFVLLSSLVPAYPGIIGSCLPQLARGIKQSLSDRDGNMKMYTLRFLTTFFATHEYSEYRNGVDNVAKDVFKLAGDSFSKVSSEAIEVINSLTCSMASSSSTKNDQFLREIYDLLLSKFQVTDMDQEVKDKTTYGLGFFISFFGDLLGPQLEKCLSLLVDRLSNEISRQSSLKALNTIARSTQSFSIVSVVPTITQHFGEFLRKTNRSLRINTLTLGISIAERSQPGNFDGIDLSSTVVEIPSLLNDKDLQITQLSLRLMALLVSKYPAQIGNIDGAINAVIDLTKSSLVQGKTQKALLDFLDALSRSNVVNKPLYRDFVSRFMEFVTSWKGFNRPAFLTVAKSIATLSRATEDVSMVLPLTIDLEKCVMKGQTLEIKILGIMAIGELGRIFPDVYSNKISIKPDEIAVSCFKPTCEEDLKMSASQALGSLAVGNIQRFLPFILKQIKEQPTRQYLLVYALRELITSDYADFAGQQLFTSQIDTIWQGIIGQANSTESTRIVVAECLGKLCITNPQKYLPELIKCFRNRDPLVRCTSLVGIRYMICDKPIPADNDLYQALPTFYEGVKDENIDARRLAIVLASTVANHKPSLIRDSLKDILPYIFLETTPRKELQREVEMGPFKNTVDDGIELRRSAFECLYNLVEHCLDRVVFHEFVENVEKGLGDTHDIKQLAYLTIIRLTETCPHQIAQHADAIAETMKTHLLSKTKQNPVKIDNDKQDEMKRMVIRALIALKDMQTHERLPKVNELFDFVTKDFAQVLAEIRSDVNA